MNIDRKRISTLVIIAMMILSVSAIFPVAAVTPPLPQLEVKLISGTTYDVVLSGEGGVNLNGYWDIIGFDLYMRYTGTVAVASIKIDPDGWFATFYPGGVQKLLVTRDNTKGFLRAVFAGQGDPHTPPNGVGTILRVTFGTITGIPHLRNPEPRPDELPTWGRDKYVVDISGYPHPERVDPPWNGEYGSPMIPHVVLPALPTASFTESATTVYKGTKIFFNASASSDQPPGSIVTYQWDWESDGTIDASGVIANKTYTAKGTYLVTLLVTDNEGLTGTVSATKYVLSKPPVGVIARSSKFINLKPNADGTYIDMGGNYTSWDDWPTHDKDVTVVRATAPKQNETSNLEDVVSPPPQPVQWVRVNVAASKMNATGDDIIKLMLVIGGKQYLAPTSIIPSANPIYTTYGYTWTKNPSTGVAWTWADLNATEAGATSIMNPKGGFQEMRITQLYVEVGYYKDVACGNPITFDAVDSYDPDGSITTYYWDWVDGTAGSVGQRVTKTWMFPGIFDVKLTLTDNEYTTGQAIIQTTILDGLPRALFTTNATTVYTFDPILFDASASYDPDGTIAKYNWEFTQIPPTGSVTKTGKIVTNYWTKAYTYKAYLEVIDNLGVSSCPEIFGIKKRTNVTITVLNRAPVAMFTESASSVYRDEVIFFDASGSYDLDGTILFYYWDFGDGTTASGKTISHAYSTAGDFKVTLTVTDDELASSTAVAYKSVANARMPPDALMVTRGWAEHAVYRVSGDEDQYNTLYAGIKNWQGDAAVEVKVVFTVYDFRTGGIGGTLEATGIVPPEQTVDLEADFDPAEFGYIPGTKTKYVAYAQLYYFDGAWNPVEAPWGTFKIEFKVVP